MKTRKLLALVLAIAMIATIFVVPMAATVEPGAACEVLGLLEGDGEGVTAEYLAKGTTRAQGLLITLRARGLEDEAKAFAGTENFTDATDVNIAFWGPILAYALANPSLGWVGDGDGTFRPADLMSGAELAKVMLAVLGYEQGVDFVWADIATFAASKGVTVVGGEVTNDDLAASLVESLALENKDGTVLIDAMIADGIVTEEAALEAGVKEETVPSAFAVEVTGVKTVKATFAEAQDTATAIVTLKKGVVGQAITVTWDAAKKVATLAKTTNLVKGDYTVTVNGESVDFTVAANETATELVVKANTVYAKAGAQDIKIHLLNQYGEQMTFTGSQIVGGASLGTLAFTSNSATLSGIVAGDKGKTSTIFAYYSPKNFTVNATLAVVEDQKLASISFTGPIALGTDSKALTRLTEGTLENTLAFKAVDQYGNTLNLTNYTAGTDYSLVVSGATATVTNGKLALTALTKGTFTVRAIVLATGNISEQYTETVYAVPALAAFDVTAPDAIYADEAANFTIAGIDQYGKPIATDPTLWTVSILSTTVTETARVNAANKITLTFGAAGTADLYFTAGSIQVVKAINVLAAKTVASIVSVPITTQALLVGKAITLDTAKVVLNDQYGNKIAIPAGWMWELRRLSETNPYGVVSTGTNATALTLAGNVITAQKAGAEQLRLTLYTGGAYGATSSSYKEFTYDFALSAVAASAVVGYELNIADEMYAGAVSAAHDKAITLIGKTANGTTVTLSSTGDTVLPDIVQQYTVTGADVQILNATSKLSTVLGVGADTTATVKAWNSAGVVVAEKTVALKKAAPVITTVTIAYDKTTDIVSVAAKDQYGVAIAAPAGKYFSSDETKLTVGINSGVVAIVGAAPKTAIIRFVSDDGVWAREISVTK